MKNDDVSLKPDAIEDLTHIYRFIVDESGFPDRAWNYIEKLCENALRYNMRR